MQRNESRGARRARRLVFVLLCFALAAPLASAQVAKIGDVVAESVSTPSPYPAGAPGGTAVWSHTFKREEATYIKVHFSRFELPEGDRLVLSDPQGSVRHVYEGRGYKELGGDFWGLSVVGDTLVATLYSQQASPGGDFGVTIDRWAHGWPHEAPPETDALCGPEDFRDIECYRDQYPTAYERGRAVVRLIKNGSAHCTGWLVSCDNHVMTNEHCVGSQSELDQIELQFEYQRSECGGGETSVTLQLHGGTLLDEDAGLDYALLMPELEGNDPASDFGYLQLDVRYPDVGELMYIPGHPSGDPKRLSIESTDPNDPTGRCEVHSIDEPACTGGPVPDVGYYCDTEGGSSGSPVLSAESHRVIALHHCANCPNRGVPIFDVYNSIQAGPNPLPACSTCEPPPVPLDLVASTPGDNRIFLDWVPSEGAVLYRIYRNSQNCDGTFEEIGTSTEPSFTDDTVAGGVTYYYRVRAESECGGESNFSNCAFSTPSGVCTEPPRFSGAAQVSNPREDECGLDVSWEAATARCGSVRYNVYRSSFPDFEPGPGNIVARCVNGTSWRDLDVLSRTPYYYVVRAEDDSESGGGPCSGGNEETNALVRSNAASGPDEIFYREGFDTPGHGWQLAGEWQISIPQGKGGSAAGGIGPADPTGTPLGASAALGMDLSGFGAQPGNYEHGLDPVSATGPLVSIGGREEVRLRYWRHLSVAASPGDQALVEACSGTDCRTLWSNPSFDMHDAEWVLVDQDITEDIAGLSELRLRFTHASDGSRTAAGFTLEQIDLYQPTSCESSAVSVPPVPDGAWAPGSPMLAERAGPGLVSVTWDVSRCVSPDYNLFVGDENTLAALDYVDASCGLGGSGSAEVAIDDPPAGGLRWWLLAGVEAGVEGLHGFDSGGAARDASGAGFCSVTEQSSAQACP